METTIFDETEYYEAEIIPLLEKLDEACRAKELPWVCSVVYRQNETNANNGIVMQTFQKQGPAITPLKISGKICEDAIRAMIAGALLKGLL